MPKKRVSLSIEVLRITERGRAAAQRIADAVFQVGDDSAGSSVAASELHEDDIRREARRVASIEDVTQRESTVFRTMASCAEFIRDAQILAGEFLRVARGLGCRHN